MIMFYFFFNDTATTELYTLSLHDALPISVGIISILWVAFGYSLAFVGEGRWIGSLDRWFLAGMEMDRSEEHTSELQSRQYLVCRLLLEKKKKQKHIKTHIITAVVR